MGLVSTIGANHAATLLDLGENKNPDTVNIFSTVERGERRLLKGVENLMSLPVSRDEVIDLIRHVCGVGSWAVGWWMMERYPRQARREFWPSEMKGLVREFESYMKTRTA